MIHEKVLDRSRSNPTMQQPEECERPAKQPQPARETVLRVDGLTKTYGEEVVTAAASVSFEVGRGEVVGLLGPNGAGKTTTIKSILGLIVPSAGTVEVAGLDASKHPRAAYGHVGAMLEGARNVYWRLTVQENLSFFAALGGRGGDTTRKHRERLLKQFGLSEMANDTVNSLSRGQKQKVSLACTLARDTDVVFLDEPTLGLDVEASLELRHELRRLADEDDVTVVLSSHDMDVVEELCDRVVILSDGRVITDDPVSDLVDVFETQAYRIEVDGSITEDTHETLVQHFEADKWNERGRRTGFDVTLTEDDSLYDALDVLRENGARIVDIDSRDPDLEDVFLEVTGRAVSNAGPSSGYPQ